MGAVCDGVGVVWCGVQDRGDGGEVQGSAGLFLRNLVCGGQRVDIWRALIIERGSEFVQVVGGEWEGDGCMVVVGCEVAVVRDVFLCVEVELGEMR